MQKRKLGRSNLEVSAVGLGCMGMSFSYGPPNDKAEMTSLLWATVERGVMLFHVSEFYDPFIRRQRQLRSCRRGCWRLRRARRDGTRSVPARLTESRRLLICRQIRPPCVRKGVMWSGWSSNQNRSHSSWSKRRFSDV